jgi:hypothetical protein
MAGGGYFGATPDDSLIAFSLPQGNAKQTEQTTNFVSPPAAAASQVSSRSAGNLKSVLALPNGNGKDVVSRMCGAATHWTL